MVILYDAVPHGFNGQWMAIITRKHVTERHGPYDSKSDALHAARRMAR